MKSSFVCFSGFLRPALRAGHKIYTTPTQNTWSQRASTIPHVMAATAAASETLSEKLKALNVSYPLPTYPNCHPEINPVDIYRAHLTTILTEITGVDAKIVYPALQWTQTLEMGDLVLPVPALRIKGKKPDELAKVWAEKVRECGVV
jgi:arginyl-tRNA synthetase